MEPEFDTTSSNGRFLLQIFGAMAEFERNLISEHTKLGLNNGRSRNRLLGRPKGVRKETMDKYRYALHLYKNEVKLMIEIVVKVSKALLMSLNFRTGNSERELDRKRWIECRRLPNCRIRSIFSLLSMQ